MDEDLQVNAVGNIKRGLTTMETLPQIHVRQKPFFFKHLPQTIQAADVFFFPTVY